MRFTIWLSSNMISNNKINFPHKLLLTHKQIVNICESFSNFSSTDVKVLKTKIFKIVQSGGILANLHGPLK